MYKFLRNNILTDVSYFSRGEKLACAKSYAEHLGDEKLELNKALNVENEKKKCLERCSVQKEYFVVTSTQFPNKNTFKSGKEICLVMKKLHQICQDPPKLEIFHQFYSKNVKHYPSNICNLIDIQIKNQTCNTTTTDQEHHLNLNLEPKLYNFIFLYAKQNLSKLKIFFRDPYYTQIRRHVKIEMVTFIGNTGGLLSLFIGFSLISVFELFYFLFGLQ